MERAAHFFLKLWLVTIVLGLIISRIHELAGGVICGLGFLFLLLAFMCEKLSPKPIPYPRNKLSTRKISMGTMETNNTTLWVSSVTAFGGEGDCVGLGNMDGSYAIELQEKFTDAFCLISKLRVRLEGVPKWRFQRHDHSILAYTGWLCFLTESGRASWPDRRLERHIMDESLKAGRSPPSPLACG